VLGAVTGRMKRAEEAGEENKQASKKSTSAVVGCISIMNQPHIVVRLARRCGTARTMCHDDDGIGKSGFPDERRRAEVHFGLAFIICKNDTPFRVSFVRFAHP
jgi:hypothetical protein